MHNVLELIANYAGGLFLFVGIIHVFFIPYKRRHAKKVIFKLVKFIIEHGYLKYKKTSQMMLGQALSNETFKNRAVYYSVMSRVIRKNLRAILKHNVLTKDEIRDFLSINRAVYAIAIIGAIFMAIWLVALGAATWIWV